MINTGHDVKMHDCEIEIIFEIIKEIMDTKIKSSPRTAIGFELKTASKKKKRNDRNAGS